ncbi:hypothetical protein D0T12_11920 [Actinomadura spongiicola]|uniref:DUF8017 domain-containing protein n=2 Tax=Actinomadura spongiicola TaxID=2303421 RepID=A0A372GK09_9ACTN|nr:hypothetical protein D0T12_11920 [Actinomadura spongiicola]
MDGEERRNPYPLPGQDWDAPKNDPHPYPLPGQDRDASDGDPPPPPVDLPTREGAPTAAPRGGRSPLVVRRRPRRAFLALVAVALLLLLAWNGYRAEDLGRNDHGDEVGTSAVPPPEAPDPEPTSTVRPKVKGWDAVSSAKYGLTYDVPKAWRILQSGVLHGYEGIDGGKPAAMSAGTVYLDDVCKDGDDEFSRGLTGFNQYIDDDVMKVAKHAANKWATHAYTEKGQPAPAITVSAPRTVRVGRARAVHVRADIVVKAKGKCVTPTGVVHVVAAPGVASGLTTTFVVVAAQGFPEALPDKVIRKVIGSLRPNPTSHITGS